MRPSRTATIAAADHRRHKISHTRTPRRRPLRVWHHCTDTRRAGRRFL